VKGRPPMDWAGSTKGSLPDLDSRPLSDLAPRVGFARGRTIGSQGSPCDHLYILAEGQVLLGRRNLEGEEYALYLLGPDDLFGEGSLTPEGLWLATARAMTDCVAYRLPAAQFPRFAQYYPQLTGYVMSLLSQRLERAHRRLDVITSNSARERLFGLLSVMAARNAEVHADEVWLPLRLTQAQLGNMVCIARETVARVLAELEAEGTIRRQGREGLWLRRSALSGWAEPPPAAAGARQE
jgi:CRP/FNR family transcriptional regulator, cyclic AMP receptor protein